MKRRIFYTMMGAIIFTLPLIGCDLMPTAEPQAVEAVSETALPQAEEAIPQAEITAASQDAPLPTPMPDETCLFTANGDLTIFTRPSTEADVFSTQADGFAIEITAQTADGWLGFDPAVAQAANMGSFRLRWVAPDAGSINNGCGSLPIVWGPPPGVCFDMPMDTVDVYESPDAGAAVVGQLDVEEFAAIMGLNPANDWAQVDLSPGNTGSTLVGWVSTDTLNMNGPCEDLPAITP